MKTQNFKKRSAFLFALLTSLMLTGTLTSCIATQPDEDAFVKQVESVPASDRINYADFDTLHDFIETTKANLIIRCVIKSRGESAVTDPSGKYSERDLKSGDNGTAQAARSLIATPYEIEISEVYLGDINKAGNTINYTAPYGIVNDYGNRKNHAPVLRVGDEYILFLRADIINGLLSYDLASPPFSVLKLNTEDNTFALYDETRGALYSKYEKSTDKLLDDLKELIENNGYPTGVEYIG